MRVLTADNDRIRRELGIELIEAERAQGVRVPEPPPKPEPKPKPQDPERVVTILDND